MSKLKIGLIGMGRLGSIHARNLANLEDTELFAVCDTDTAALDRAKSVYNARTFTNIDQFLQEPLDGVVIASNTHLHIEHIKAVANAGINIFTEKPIGLSMNDTDEALQHVVDSGVLFQIGFQRRWDPRFIQAKVAIDSGEIGQPVLFKAYGRDPNASSPNNWGLDKNGGLFLNAAIHDYDAARFILGKEVSKLSATGNALVYSDLKKFKDIDTCSTTLFFDDSAMAITEWSRYATYGYDVAVEVVGTEGVIRIGHAQDSAFTILRKNEHAPTLFDEFSDAYRNELYAFALSIKDKSAPTPGIEDARIALQLALCARESFDTDSKLTKFEALTPLVKQS